MQSSRLGGTRETLILPKVFESLRAELGIAHRVCDVFVPEVLLNGPGVLAVARELVASRVPQHVRMDREGELGERACACHQFSHRRRRHRTAALGHEQIRRIRILPLELGPYGGEGQKCHISGSQISWVLRSQTGNL